MVRKYITKKEKARAVERKLLPSLARGKKSFQDVVVDAEVFSFADTSLQRLVTSKASVGVAQRSEELTGIGNNSLERFPIRFKADDGTPITRQHPFALLSPKNCFQFQ